MNEAKTKLPTERGFTAADVSMLASNGALYRSMSRDIIGRLGSLPEERRRHIKMRAAARRHGRQEARRLKASNTELSDREQGKL